MWDWARPVLVSGGSPLLERVCTGLRAGGRRARIVPFATLARRRPPWGRTLVLAEETPDTTLAGGLMARWAEARTRGRPIRLIQLHATGAQAPAWDGDLARLAAAVRLEQVTVAERAARVMLRRWPPHRGFDPVPVPADLSAASGPPNPPVPVPHVLVAGDGDLAAALLIQVLRLLHYGDERPWVTRLCADPETAARRFRRALPGARAIARVRFRPFDAPDLAPAPPVSLGWVCLEAPLPERVLVAERLVARIAAEQGASPLLLLEIGDRVPSGHLDDWDGQILPFSALREVCRPEVLLDGLGDETARCIQDHYRDTIAAQGRDPASEPAGQDWETLAPSYRGANRVQADHLWAKLAIADTVAVPVQRMETFAFAPAEVEQLARIEHRRWCADRRLDGWRYGPRRDNARQRHPQLIPFDRLSPAMQDLDRFAVRAVPALLARAGLGLLRLLILGVAPAAPGGDGPLGRAAPRLLEAALAELSARYPDRIPMIATTLLDAPSRSLARLALERDDTRLLLLFDRPLSALLAAQPDPRTRRDCLALVAACERRVPLAGADAVEQWIATRAAIRIEWAGAAARSGTPPGHADSARTTARRLRIDLIRRTLDWNFTY